MFADTSGDAFFFSTIRSNRAKAWVDSIFVPVTVFLALSCGVLFVSLAAKVDLLVWRIRSRFQMESHVERSISLGAINLPKSVALSRSSTVIVLKQKLDIAKIGIRKNYCRLLIGILQDLPMGACL